MLSYRPSLLFIRKLAELVFIRKLRMDTNEFLIRKRAIFRKVKEIEALRGGVRQYAAQARPRIDAEIAKKGRFRTETN